MRGAPRSRRAFGSIGLAAWWMVAAVGQSSAQPAEPQDPAALVAAARALEHGEGVPKDQIRAAQLYCDAARAGDAEAAYSLGWMYANGRGIARNDMVAAALFALAADAGHAYARRALAVVGQERGSLPECMRKVEVLAAIPESAEFEITLDEPDPFRDLPPWKEKIAGVVRELAPKYAVSAQLALAVIAVESNFDATARSEKNAQGLMQLIPATAARFAVKDAYDVKDNVRGGLAYLRWLLAYYRGQVSLAAAAYNAGEKAVDYYRGIPPYAETRDYVQRIQRLYPKDRHPYDARITDPSPIVGLDAARP